MARIFPDEVGAKCQLAVASAREIHERESS
jgi:hypothetical protein